MKLFAKVIGTTPPAICLVLGGIGWLMHIDGAGWLLLLGGALQVVWLLLTFR